MSDSFEFEAGDRVLVRVRENGTSGRLVAKFVAEVDGFSSDPLEATSDEVKLSTSWAPLTIRLRPYEAEFEVVEDGDEVRF